MHAVFKIINFEVTHHEAQYGELCKNPQFFVGTVMQELCLLECFHGYACFSHIIIDRSDA